MAKGDGQNWRGLAIDEEVLRTLYLHEGLTQREIAKYFNCSPAPIMRALHKLGIVAPKRSPPLAYPYPHIARKRRSL